jgi:hypothetical protein
LHPSQIHVLCLFVSDTAPLTPPERFNRLIEALFDDIRTRATHPWGRLALVELVLIKLIWRRLRRMNRRFADIVAAFRAGTLAHVDSEPRRVSRPSGSPRGSAPWRRFGWVIYAVSYFVWSRHYELEELLEDPEMALLVAGAPQLGRELRPLCRMLAVKPPEWLRPKRRVPRHVPEPPPPPAPDWLLAEPGAELRADGSVWMRLGSSTHWRPGCGVTLEQAQRIDHPVKIWPRDE